MNESDIAQHARAKPIPEHQRTYEMLLYTALSSAVWIDEGDYMTSKEHTYNAIRVQQRPSAPAFYMIGAPAREITKWADAPHKKTTLRAGYQRELEERRINSIEKFLKNSPNNILPSAVLIAVRTENISIEESSGQFKITITSDSLEPNSLRHKILTELRERLSDEELRNVPEISEELQFSDFGDIDLDPIATLDDEADTDALAPDSYLSSLYAELSKFEYLDPKRKREMDEFVHTMSVPGLIMDGQHRIFGAKEVAGEEIILPVVLVPGLELSEQVFNFYVLNNKAKPLDKRQLRSIIATSLTKGEIDDLYDRFRTSGLRADEAQWTYRVNSDPDSPFKDLISLRLDGDTAPIDDNVMDQVVARFIKLPKSYQSLKKGVDWDSGDPDYSRRLGLFYSLWRAVKVKYPIAWAAAESGRGNGQLFQKVALLQLQAYVLEVLKQVVPFQAESPFASPDKLYEATTTALGTLPEEFFTKEWKKKGLDTNSGRILFLEQLQKVAAADGKRIGSFSLFKDA
ncbi:MULTISPECIES: hypothetical protein [Rhodococcus]|nr:MULTISPECIES: hypothetical protein [Rhodococcus]MDV7245320.1 hypothetical protein [Rhodococcus oxybenzonivorans]MDV7336345.1 hypothetical protein [Rhodococcus oxybenzonivorans]MDV8025406.1 hypothetical protein [Rhodococcus sp. IEGM 27]MDV8105175.1 hypothetical protein [Rhodococcus sp. IEGM 69]